MSTNAFTKQNYESFTIACDFSNNFEVGETISSQTALAFDKDGNDVTSTVLDTGTLTNDGTAKVTILVRDGLENNSPYKITIRCVTNSSHKWEMDIQMTVKEY